ncbi:MAG: hypothetical protein R3E90_10695 [Marinicella sp.]|nr:hypothetical protein [Xanthomonadales bacterium]
MNIKCIHCQQPTIAKKWLVLSVLLPFVFIFVQIRCGRCKQEQFYELNMPFLLDLLLDVLLPIGAVIGSVYLFVFVNGNLLLMGVFAALLFLTFWGLRLYCYLKKYG